MSQDDPTFQAALAAGVHDIKNLLFEIDGRLPGVMAALAENAPEKTTLRRISRQIGMVNQRLIGLIQLYRAEHGQLAVSPRPLQVEDLIDEVCLDAREQLADLPLQLTTDINLPPHLTRQLDREALLSVLAHAFANAARFAHSEIRFSVCLDADQFLICCIEDDGPGFGSPQEAARKGTGIGLLVSRHLIAAHGHHGRAASLISDNDSKLGGARVTIRLP